MRLGFRPRICLRERGSLRELSAKPIIPSSGIRAGKKEKLKKVSDDKEKAGSKVLNLLVRNQMFNNDMEKKSRKKEREKKELLRALFERYWQTGAAPESDIHRNLEHPTNVYTAAHTSHSLSLRNQTRG